MKDAAPQTVYLADYTPFGYVIEDVHLTVRLDPGKTRVQSRIRFAPNPEARDRDFFLHGEDLTLLWAKIDGAAVTPQLSDQGLRCTVPDGPFIWEAEVEIAPSRRCVESWGRVSRRTTGLRPVGTARGASYRYFGHET